MTRIAYDDPILPGDRIIEQGTDGTSMFILWVGTANVVKEEATSGWYSRGSCFGVSAVSYLAYLLQ